MAGVGLTSSAFAENHDFTFHAVTGIMMGLTGVVFAETFLVDYLRFGHANNHYFEQIVCLRVLEQV